MQKTNVELAREQGCTARQISKSRRRGLIMKIMRVVGRRNEREAVKFTAPAPHLDERSHLAQKRSRAERERVERALAAAEKASEAKGDAEVADSSAS